MIRITHDQHVNCLNSTLYHMETNIKIKKKKVHYILLGVLAKSLKNKQSAYYIKTYLRVASALSTVTLSSV